MRRASLVLAVAMVLPFASAPRAAEERQAIVAPEGATFAETLAARELRRYVYLRTGQLLPVVPAAERVPERATIVVAGKDRPIARAVAKDAKLQAQLAELKPQEYLLKTIEADGSRVALIAGGDDAGVLYGAYRFAEHLGVRFYLHGDVIPDARIALELPVLDERGKPLFELRGIQPFHDFPEGPDWWNLDDYKTYISQLPKLRMNFFGLHTYPEGIAEPTVWIGLPEDVDADGKVLFSYPSSYHNTLRGDWGYAPRKTGDYVFGGSQLFERDDFGGDVMRGFCPRPTKPEDCNELFNRTGALLRDAFRHAHRLSVKTCVGTETPLTVPRLVAQRMREKKKDAGVQPLYEGLFLRIMRTYPVDYYWFWTPEGWTWGGTSQAQVNATVADLKLAMAAAKAVNAPFTLATCGWVLGPPQDRALFDKVFPKEMPVSCISRQVGQEPVEPGFAKVSAGRPKWSIPWMEDDPALASPQLWAGRMRKDAADSLRYGCTGLMGIHWRTRILGPNVSALAQAAWDQSVWNPPSAKPVEPPRTAGPVGGNVAAFPGNRIADTEDAPLYQTVRYGVSAYHLPLPKGTYTVTLKFCEPHYKEAGARVFGVKLQDKPVIDKLDIFAKVGQNRALDYTFKDVAVSNGWLDIEFVPEVEFPSIAAIVAEGPATKKVNCGGPAYKDYAADWPAVQGPPPNRFAPTGDFYQDYARQSFGPEVAAQAAAIFQKMDGHLPRPSDWVDGPGGLRPDGRPWEQASKDYAFVDELEALRPKVQGAGNLERFDYWLSNFRYMRATAHVDCLWTQYNTAIAKVKAEKDPEARKRMAREAALPVRKQLVGQVGEAYRHLLLTVSTPGELGTVMNIEQHNLPRLLVGPGDELSKILGEPLPADAVPSKEYDGPPRLIVPTVRSCVAQGEVLRLKVIILSSKPPREAALFWRPMGPGEFAQVPLTHVARGVYSVQFPPDGARADLEYYVQAVPDDGTPLRFPATAPTMGQTVLVVSE